MMLTENHRGHEDIFGRRDINLSYFKENSCSVNMKNSITSWEDMIKLLAKRSVPYLKISIKKNK